MKFLFSFPDVLLLHLNLVYYKSFSKSNKLNNTLKNTATHTNLVPSLLKIVAIFS